MRRAGAVFLALLLALILPGCTQQSESVTGFYMDTVVELTATGRSAKELLAACSSRLASLENCLSAHRKGSDISCVNSGAGDFVSVGEDTYAVISLALQYAELTGGAYDPTILPAVQAWDSMSGQRIPSEEELLALQPLVDYTQVELDPEARAVKLASGQGLDLGGIGKGYAADILYQMYQEAGCTGIINLGGNIYAVGCKTNGSPWQVAVQDPRSNAAYAAVWELTDACAVTSGNYQRYFEKDGVRYHHILDPKTLYPTENGLSSVTISCASAAMADALATAAMVLGPDEGKALLEAQGLQALLIFSDGAEIELSARE